MVWARAIKNFKRAVTSANEIEVSPKKGEIPASRPRPASDQSSEPGGQAVVSAGPSVKTRLKQLFPGCSKIPL